MPIFYSNLPYRDPRIDSGVTTPAATVATSIRTNASRIPRRCVTPDPSPHTKPKLVVDLRKSHSQVSSKYKYATKFN